MRKWLIAGFRALAVSVLPPAWAGNAKQQDGYTVYYSAVNADLLDPRVARAYGLGHRCGRGLLTVSLHNRGGDPVPAEVRVTRHNLIGQQQFFTCRGVAWCPRPCTMPHCPTRRGHIMWASRINGRPALCQCQHPASRAAPARRCFCGNFSPTPVTWARSGPARAAWPGVWHAPCLWSRVTGWWSWAPAPGAATGAAGGGGALGRAGGPPAPALSRGEGDPR